MKSTAIAPARAFSGFLWLCNIGFHEATFYDFSISRSLSERRQAMDTKMVNYLHEQKI